LSYPQADSVIHRLLISPSAAVIRTHTLWDVRIKVALLVVLGCAVIGASCSHDPDPTPVPTGSPVVNTPTVAPPPEMPTLAREDSPAGAEAFARYWLVALDYAYWSGETRVFRSLGACAGCRAIADAVDRVTAGGGHIEGGRIRFLDGRMKNFTPGKTSAIEAYYAQNEGQTIYGDGHVSVVPSASRLGFLFSLNRTVGRWQVASIQTIRTG
jgi:hypothetical protein